MVSMDNILVHNKNVSKPINNPNQLVDNFRTKKDGLYPLGDKIPTSSKDGTVAFVDIDGKAVFGVNSGVLVRNSDKNLARQWRDRLIEKYPNLMNTNHKGQMPNNSLFHAEGHSLMRAYEKTGGNMPSTVNMYFDRFSCNSCQTVLPSLTNEMGIKKLNLTFKDGSKAIIENGKFREIK